MTIVLTEQGEFSAPAAQMEGDRLWVPAHDLEAATGWSLKREGLCKGPLCVPIPAGRETDYVRGDRVNPAGFWAYLGHPVCHSADGSIWAFGEGAQGRAKALRSLEAPDFALPDRQGRLHRLSDHRGKQVFLVSWASW